MPGNRPYGNGAATWWRCCRCRPCSGTVEWLQAAGNYVNLHVRGRDYPLRTTMAAIEAQLDPARFVRVHRSYIVNLNQVGEIEPLDTGDARIRMRDGTPVPCSRTYRDALRPDRRGSPVHNGVVGR